MSNTLKWIMAFILVLLPSISFGDASSSLWDIAQNLSFTPPKGDLSIDLLAKMFGNVPGIPQFMKSGKSIIGAVFTVFNTGVLALSGVFLSYTITKILTETTMDGAAMGKSTTIWTAIRCALSTSLLVPQASGYSTINGIVMWVVVQSVGLADLTWSYAVDYIKSGNSIYSTPKSQIDYSLINWDISSGKQSIDKTNKKINVGAVDVLRSLTCSYVIHAALQYRQDLTRNKLAQKKLSGGLSQEEQIEYSNALSIIPLKSETGFSVYRDAPPQCASRGSGGICNKYTDGTIQFPYIKNESKDPYKNRGLQQVPSISKDLSEKCGTISYIVEKSPNESDSTYAERANRYIEAKHRGLLSMIDILEPVAKQLVQKMKFDFEPKDLNPYSYIVYKNKEGPGNHFLKDRSSDADKTNMLVTTYASLAAMDVTTLRELDIQWPLGSSEILQAAVTYQLALSEAQSAGANTLSQIKKGKLDEAKKQGWITAGNYYRLLATMGASENEEYSSYRLVGYKYINEPFQSDTIENRDLSAPSRVTLFKQANDINPDFNTTSINRLWTDSGDTALLDRALTWIDLVYPYARLNGQVLSSSSAGTVVTGAGNEATNVIMPMLAAFVVLYGENFLWANLITGATMLILTPPLAIPLLMPIPIGFLFCRAVGILGYWFAVMGPLNAGQDPVTKLQNLGSFIIDSMLYYFLQLQIFYAIVTVVVSTAQFGATVVSIGVSLLSFWDALTGVSAFVQALLTMYTSLIDFTDSVISMNMPLALAFFVPMFVAGITLAVYVPLVPCMLFLFGAISWFISILVLMAAAPIICFLMLWGNSSQENPLLSREAEQFMMQIIGIFFRPILMVIGLIAGMVLSYIGVDLLNTAFSSMLEIAVNGFVVSPGWLFQLVGVIVAYTSIMVAIVNMCFSTIHLLYSETMRIIGISAPAVGLEEKHMEGVKGSITQFAEAGAGGMKESAGSLKGTSIKYKDLSNLDFGKKDKGDQSGAKGD